MTYHLTNFVDHRSQSTLRGKHQNDDVNLVIADHESTFQKFEVRTCFHGKHLLKSSHCQL